MKILALELSSSRRSVAAWDATIPDRPPCVAVSPQGSDPRRSEAFSLIRQALEESGLQPGEIECIAVGVGPGSYTGIRAAISIAQGWSAGRPIRLIPVRGVDILAAMAHAAGIRGRIRLAFDAQRGEAYACQLQLNDNGPVQQDELRLMSVEELRALSPEGSPTMGPDLDTLMPEARPLHPDAGQMARLAATTPVSAQAGDLTPIYLREVQFIKAV